MAHNVEPMDVDSEFDNKENSYHHSNVQPCTEKGYEELDVSELNMKLRYSVTPASSPMSKSYTANCPEYRSFESGDDSPNIIKNDNANLTRSLNSNLKTDNVTKSLKMLPLQMISTEQFNDNKNNASVLRPLDTVVTSDDTNITVTVSKPIDIDENLSLPSSSSSTAQTPEATTPTKDIPKTDGGSPIMRGLKSVLNMFRSSQSPIPPAEGDDATKQEVLSPAEMTVKPAGSTAVMASTPISAHRKKETSPSKRNSPYRESIVFNDDLEKELQWKDETTILFSQERIPIHKLFFQQPVDSKNTDKIENGSPLNPDKTLNSNVEFMDISFNDSALGDQTLQPDGNKSIGNKTDTAFESDSEFVDCETTFTKNESCVIDDKIYEENDHVENLNVTKNVTNNGSRSKLNPIILNTTQDILDATLSITPEDIASQIIDRVQDLPATLVMPSVNCDPLDNVQDTDKFNEIETIKLIVENKEEYANKIEEKNFENTDQTFGIINQAVDFSSENLNLTNTSENIPVEIKMALDKPQKIFADNANVTQSSDNAHVGNKTITDQVSGPNSEKLNVTHNFEVSHVECNLLEHNDADGTRNTIFNISNEGEEISVQDNVNDEEILIVECNVKEVIMQKMEAVPNPAENINATNDCNILTVNKAGDHNNVLENNNLITEHEFALEHYELNIPKEITNISNMEKIISSVESANKPFEGNDMLHDNYVSLEEKSVVELPADIPLPDEDDIEKETTVKVNTIELRDEFICTPPPDLVDVLKLKTENTKDNNVIFSIDNEEILKPVLLTHDAVKEAINDRETVSQFSQTKHDCHDVNEDSNLKNDNLRLCVTPQVLLLQNKILPWENTNVHTDQVPIRSEKLNETITSMEPLNNKIVPKAELLDINLPMHKNESVCDFKVLPDVINQIINSPCNEIPQSVDKINEIVEQQFESSIGDSTKQNVKSNLSPVTENKPTVTDSTPQKTQLVMAMAMDKSYGTDMLISKTVDENAKPVEKTSAIVEKQYESTIGDSTEQNVKSYLSSTTEIISSILENTATDTIPTITDSTLQETELEKNNDTDLSTPPKNVDEIDKSIAKTSAIIEKDLETSIGDSTKQNLKRILSPVATIKPTVTDNIPQKKQLEKNYGLDVSTPKNVDADAKKVEKTCVIIEKQYESTIGDSTEQNVKSYLSSTTEIISSILENTATDTIPTITDSTLQETELEKNNDTDLSTPPKNVDEIDKSIAKTSAIIEKDLETSIGDSTKQNLKRILSPVATIKPTVTDNIPQKTQLEKNYGLDVSTPKNIDADAKKVEKTCVIIEKQFESSIGNSTKQNVKNNLSSDTEMIPSISENIATETKHTITNNTLKETDLEKNNGTDVSMPKNVDQTAKSTATIEQQLESSIGDSTEPNIRSKLTSATEIMPSILDNTLQETELEKNNGTDVSTPKNVDEIAKSDDKINKIVEQQFQSSIGDSTDQNVMCYLSSVTEFKPSFTDNISQETKLEKNYGTEISRSKIDIEDIPIVSKIQQITITMSIDEENEVPKNVITSQQEAEIVTPNQTNNNMQFEKELAPAEKKNISSYDNITEPESKVLDEEIVVSENNSPFVCVLAETEVKTDDIENSFATKTKIVSTPPPSPPITSKGYNFNFDEMDDPFDTNAKIRMSPTPDSPNKQAEPKVMEQKIEKQAMSKKEKNRRKSQPERKLANKTKLNSTFNNSITDTRAIEKPIEKVEVLQSKAISVIGAIKSEPLTSVFEKEDKEVQDIIKRANENIEIKLQEALKAGNKRKSSNVEELVEAVSVVAASLTDSITELKTSSSEQSTYFSAGTSSSESLKSRNVFNIPEIDDMNFNPFATKSKMRQSPPLVQDIDNPFATRSKMMTSPIGDKSLLSKIHLNHTKTTNINATNPLLDDKMETEPMEKDTSNNICDTTSSSTTIDERDATIKEINTEDEDTIEGPFLDPEDLQNDDKNIVCDTENDMMQFNELPAQTKEETPEADELFIDAEAFEFLLNQNKSNTVVDSGKESLFLKFDPLFAKRVSSDSVLSALTKLQKRQSTPVKLKPKQKEVVSPIAGPSNMNITRDIDLNMSEELNDDFNVTVSKPMMVVPPAINSVTPRNKSITPTRSNRRSITFTSPAMAVIDRLLSLSANNSPVHDNTYTQVSREQNEADIALSQLRELLAEKEIHVYNLRSESKELKDRLSTMESTVRSLETESQGRLKKINDLNDQLAEKTKINRSMAAVVEEYERTIASLIAETEQDKKRHAEERAKLISERDEQTAHLASMEVSFSDLHSKYEKSKHVILSCKANEEAYKKSIKDFEENLSKMQTNYELLKQHATSKLNHANQELEKMNRSHEAEVLKLNAMIKRKELHITSLEETLTQKTKANEELTAICDELINKVG